MWNGKRLNECKSWMATLNTAMRRYSNALVCLMAMLTLITTVGCDHDDSDDESMWYDSSVDLVVLNVTAPLEAETGTSISVEAAVGNVGDGDATGIDSYGNKRTGFRVGIYLSPDSHVTGGDILLETWYVERLDGKRAIAGTKSVTIPSYVSPGTYFIGVFIDDLYSQRESNEWNNSRGTMITITEPAPAIGTSAVTAEAIDQDTETDDLDLTVAHVEEVGPGRYNPGDVIAIESAIENRGSVPAYSFTVALYASSDPDITRADYFLGHYTINALAPGAMDENPTLCALPSSIPDGFYFIGAIVDDGDDLPESDETNNAISASCSIEVVTPASEEPL